MLESETDDSEAGFIPISASMSLLKVEINKIFPFLTALNMRLRCESGSAKEAQKLSTDSNSSKGWVTQYRVINAKCTGHSGSDQRLPVSM